MTEQQLAAYEQLQTIPEKVRFLLDIGVTADLDMEELDITYRAHVGDVRLPVSGASRLTAIERGKAWLEEKLAQAEGDNA